MQNGASAPVEGLDEIAREGSFGNVIKELQNGFNTWVWWSFD
jgi:hypothetical protein